VLGFNELVEMWKEAVAACFVILSWHSVRVAKKNDEDPVRVDGIRVKI
jgi:hypothetical protein